MFWFYNIISWFSWKVKTIPWFSDTLWWSFDGYIILYLMVNQTEYRIYYLISYSISSYKESIDKSFCIVARQGCCGSFSLFLVFHRWFTPLSERLYEVGMTLLSGGSRKMLGELLLYAFFWIIWKETENCLRMQSSLIIDWKSNFYVACFLGPSCL